MTLSIAVSLCSCNACVLCRPKIVEGRLNKIRSQKALLEQPFIKDTGNSVAEHIKAAVANLGENIQVRACWRVPYVLHELQCAQRSQLLQ